MLPGSHQLAAEGGELVGIWEGRAAFKDFDPEGCRSGALAATPFGVEFLASGGVEPQSVRNSIRRRPSRLAS